jgi:hypothetical protein
MQDRPNILDIRLSPTERLVHQIYSRIGKQAKIDLPPEEYLQDFGRAWGQLPDGDRGH